MIITTVGIQEDPSYEGYYRQLRMMNDQLNEVAELMAWRTKKTKAFLPPTTQDTKTGLLYDTIDWQPTIAVLAARPKEGR